MVATSYSVIQHLLKLVHACPSVSLPDSFVEYLTTLLLSLTSSLHPIVLVYVHELGLFSTNLPKEGCLSAIHRAYCVYAGKPAVSNCRRISKEVLLNVATECVGIFLVNTPVVLFTSTFFRL